MKITYYLEVISSWCYWAELKQRYAGQVEFQWKIAHMPPDAFPRSQAQAEWFYRRSGTLMRSPFMLNAGWFEPGDAPYQIPSLVAEAAKDFNVTDDRVRLALAHAGEREGKKIGRWEIAVEIAAAAAGLDRAVLLKRAQSPEVAARTRATTAEFDALQVNQRPTFLLENNISDRAVFSGLAKIEPLAITLDAMLSDATAYQSYAAHFGPPPPA
ncbi:MAG: disulfide bond formation protein DsbA [Pedosphaera sp.]|nr:disulfide bond formation protein DsbA [Pedosphaera sp.]